MAHKSLSRSIFVVHFFPRRNRNLSFAILSSTLLHFAIIFPLCAISFFLFFRIYPRSFENERFDRRGGLSQERRRAGEDEEKVGAQLARSRHVTRKSWERKKGGGGGGEGGGEEGGRNTHSHFSLAPDVVHVASF